MNAAIILAVAVSASSPPPAVADVASLHAAIGAWRLSEVGGKVACTLTLTDQPSPGGRTLQAPAACHQAFPPLKDLSVWSLDAHGEPVFSDAAHSHVVAFNGPVGGPFQATASDGKAWRLELAAHDAVAAPQ